MSWIESHKNLGQHPKLLKLCARMNWDEDMAIGKLHRFWWWASEYSLNGDLRKFQDTDIAIAMRVPLTDATSLMSAMIECRLIDTEPYIRIHDWWDFAGRYIQGRFSRTPDKWKAIQAEYEKVAPSPTKPVTNLQVAYRKPVIHTEQTEQKEQTPKSKPTFNIEPGKEVEFSRPKERAAAPVVKVDWDKCVSPHQLVARHFIKRFLPSIYATATTAYASNFFARHGADISKIIKATGDADLAIQAMDLFADDYGKKGLTWNLSTFARNCDDYLEMAIKQNRK